MTRLVALVFIFATFGGCTTLPCASGFETYVEGGEGNRGGLDIRGGVSIHWDMVGTCTRLEVRKT